ncbi:hypothetical protein D7S86_12645 [Pararobbsia silviterrae]|uniref:Uncharacterized protein n=2 Tax=Pararobbsia silviterrae TaxID=1792498 RepID=A0A494Y4M2_9BURK|nr:hypothetical protein D7S86_12645 [Pararobbsia silviterrae]
MGAGGALWLLLAASGTLPLPAPVAPVIDAQAQAGRAPPVKNPVLDGTPEIDASIANHNWSQALSQLDEHLKTHPLDAQAKFKRATVLARMGRDDDAITAFQALTQQYPELPEPYNNLAALYAKHGQYDSARATLETAITANPGFALGYQNLGSLYLKLAQDAYTHASTLNKRDADSRSRATKIGAILSPASATAAAPATPASASASAPASEATTEPALPGLPAPEILPSEPSTGGMPVSPSRN